MVIRARGLVARLAVLGVLLWLAGCAGDSSKPDGPVYAQAKSLPPLEVPPDLSSPGFDDTYAVPTADGRYSARQLEGAAPVADPRQAGVLPATPQIQVQRVGDMRWFEVNDSPEVLWPKLHKFWEEQGLTLAVDDPKTGVMQTEWAEDRAGVLKGSWRRYLGALYDAGRRDMYRVRLERGEDGKTLIFLTHRGAHDVAVDENIVRWELGPSDPELEAVMQTRLMVFLGAGPEQAKQAIAQAPSSAIGLELTQIDKQPVLVVEDRFPRTWRRVGMALDRLSLVVDDQDRSAGIYYVTYKGEEEERGFFSRRKPGELRVDEQYQVHVTEAGARTELSAYDVDGHPLREEKATEILRRLENELK